MGNTIQKYTILAFDPGLANTGWSLLSGNVRNGELTVLKMGEFHPGPTADRVAFRDQVEKFDKRVISLSLLREEMTKLLNEAKPDFVCCEDIFISMLHPQAYGSLSMWICTAKLTVFDVLKQRLTIIPTKICKKVLTGSGGNGKLSVQASVVAHKLIHFKNEEDKMRMTEHEADSIAVAAAFNECHRDYILASLGQR